MLGVLLARLALAVLHALFLGGYAGVRRGSLAPAAAMAALYAAGAPPEAVLAGLLATYAAAGSLTLLAYASALASVPAAWMSLTQLAYDAAVSGALEPGRYAAIALRSLAASLLALYILHSLNPLELGYAVRRLTGSCAAAYAAPFALRVVGHVLREASEAVAAHTLRGVRPWVTLALLLLRAEEVSRSLEEAIALRLRVCRPRPSYDPRALAAQALGLAVAALAPALA